MNEFTYQEKIQRFKSLAKQYYKMQKEILRLKSQIEEINERLVDYRSPSWEKIGYTTLEKVARLRPRDVERKRHCDS